MSGCPDPLLHGCHPIPRTVGHFGDHGQAGRVEFVVVFRDPDGAIEVFLPGVVKRLTPPMGEICWEYADAPQSRTQQIDPIHPSLGMPTQMRWAWYTPNLPTFGNATPPSATPRKARGPKSC